MFEKASVAPEALVEPRGSVRKAEFLIPQSSGIWSQLTPLHWVVGVFITGLFGLTLYTGYHLFNRYRVEIDKCWGGETSTCDMAQLLAQVGDAWALPLGLLSVAGIMFTGIFVLIQIKEDQKQALPQVFMKVRLNWDIRSVQWPATCPSGSQASSAGLGVAQRDAQLLETEVPCVEVEFYNDGDVSAVDFVFEILELRLIWATDAKQNRHVVRDIRDLPFVLDIGPAKVAQNRLLPAKNAIFPLENHDVDDILIRRKIFVFDTFRLKSALNSCLNNKSPANIREREFWRYLQNNMSPEKMRETVTVLDNNELTKFRVIGSGEFLQSLLLNEGTDDFPVLEMRSRVHFTTQRNVHFKDEIRCKWSPSSCHNFGTDSQKYVLTEIGNALRTLHRKSQIPRDEQLGQRALNYDFKITNNPNSDDLSQWSSVNLYPHIWSARFIERWEARTYRWYRAMLPGLAWVMARWQQGLRTMERIQSTTTAWAEEHRQRIGIATASLRRRLRRWALRYFKHLNVGRNDDASDD